jgi:NAD(P)-dependent dehydrogenase (short-subunit alcohol dehydrogenase family)
MTDAPVTQITGGASGIVAATARRLLDQAHRVTTTGRDHHRPGRFAEELGEPAGLLTLAGDAADYTAVQAAVESTVHKFGRLDTVVANAGFATHGTLADGDPDRWRKMVLTNVLGPALLIKAALPALQQTRERIVLLGSVAGFVHTPGNIDGVTKMSGDGAGREHPTPGDRRRHRRDPDRSGTGGDPLLGCRRRPSCRWTADRRPDRRLHRVGNQPAERCRRQHRDRQTDRSAWVITIYGCRTGAVQHEVATTSP